MTRCYRHPIRVHLKNDQPYRFTWRDTTYRVRTILAVWHLRDRWWFSTTQTSSASLASSASQMTPVTSTPGKQQNSQKSQECQESDRLYYRLDCSPDLQCELYHDRASGLWILDRVYD
jgi:hypothetical protein